MLFEIFAIGGILFWLLCAAYVGSTFLFLEKGNTAGSITSFVVFVVAIELFSSVSIFGMIWANPLLAGTIIAAYLAGVVIWPYVKWEFYTSKKARKVAAAMEIVDEFARKQALRAIAGRGRSLPLKVSEHKAMLISWAVNWPLSMIWTVINDPVTRFAEEMYSRSGKFLQARSDAKFAHLNLDDVKDL